MEREDKDKQPQPMVACASAHPQFEAQLENTPATQLEVASTTPVTPETQQVAIPHVPQLPTEVWQIILLFHCHDDKEEPENIEKVCANLRLVCRTFNAIIMTFPEMWDYANTPLITIKRTKNFLTHCPFKNFLHVTVDLNRTNLLDASNQATFEALKTAMAENKKQFTLKLRDPSEEQQRTLSELPCALSVAYHLQDLPLGPWRNLQTLAIMRKNIQNLPLAQLTNLTHLIVRYCKNLHNITSDHLPHLYTLDIQRCPVLPQEQREALKAQVHANGGQVEPYAR